MPVTRRRSRILLEQGEVTVKPMESRDQPSHNFNPALILERHNMKPKRSSRNNVSPARQPSPWKLSSTRKQTLRVEMTRFKSTETSVSDDSEDPEDMHTKFAYEEQRQANVRANAEFFTQLGISEAKMQLDKVLAKRNKLSASHRGLKPEKPPVEKRPRRQSLRIQNVRPPKPLYVPEMLDKGVSDDHPRLPPGPLEMGECLYGEQHRQVHLDFVKDMRTTCVKSAEFKPTKSDLKSFLDDFSRISIATERVAKVVKSRIFSLAVHPTTDKVLVAVGDKLGNVGFWDVQSAGDQDGVVAYSPHSAPVNCIVIPPWSPLSIFSCSYDGTLRCGHFEKAVFDEVHSCPEDDDVLLRNFDFHSENVLLVSQSDGCVGLIDIRTERKRAEHLYPCHLRNLRTVSIHPVQTNYFVTTAIDGKIRLWDLRKMSKKSNTPIAEQRHERIVNSAYFSPVTGKYILSTSADNTVKIFDSAKLTKDLNLKKSIRHDNRVGRWLTKFRATWHPAREDLFVVGSMKRPRQIELFSDDGAMVKALSDPDCLTSVCSLNVIHPTRDVLVGGNSSGRVHVFM